VDEIEDLGHADVRDRLVQDLLGFDRRDPDGERGAQHDAVLAQGLAGDDCRQLDHQPGPNVKLAVPEHLVEGKVVEDLDELGVGHRQGGDVAGKKLVVILARSLTGSHRCSPCYLCGRSLRRPQVGKSVVKLVAFHASSPATCANIIPSVSPIIRSSSSWPQAADRPAT
jgi:hypothetical protein